MSIRATIPDLDAECEYLRGLGPNAANLTATAVVERLQDDADEYGLQLRFWKRGEGEWFWYLTVDGDEFACFNPDNEATDSYDDAGDIEIAVRNAEDAWLVPRERLPKWGDWSAHRSCSVCSGALREADSVETERGYAHEVCTTMKPEETEE